MQHAIVNLNGRIVDIREAKVSVFDHGFLFGYGVYETLRTYLRVPFLFDRHLRRLRESAAALSLPVPVSDDELREWVAQTIEALPHGGEAYIRLLLTRGPGEFSYDPSACPSPTVVVIVRPFAEPPPRVFERGVRIALVSVMRNHPASVDPRIKSNNLLNNALAMQEAIRRGAEEALMRNYRGELAECAQSNLFVVRDGQVLTPPAEAGLLRGITRDFVFEVGRAAGFSVAEATLRDADLFAADEAFITGTTREITPVVQVDDRPIGDGRPGPTTLRLLSEFRRLALEWTARELGRGRGPAAAQPAGAGGA
ncbi:MAG TPA: aminotransferase class IV [Vicinamibacterales bacterium]|nr:aminotransferase class IV [Vicinamibacterales bacterium]